jgi:serine/threonine-protein kinase
MSDFLSRFDKDNKEKEESEMNSFSKTQSRKTRTVKESDGDENKLEYDPSFKKKRLKKWLLSLGIFAVILSIGGVLFVQFAYIRVDKFVDKEISDVREWAAERNLAIDVTPAYDEAPINHVIAQKEEYNSRVRKKSTLHLTVSQGPDPEEKLELPDFMEMSRDEAANWIEKYQAINLSLVDEFHDEIEEKKPIRFEFTNKEVSRQNYLRRDVGKIIFSKGKETFEKDITVPDFKGKALSEVETWAKNHELDLEVKEVASDTIEDGKIIEQSIATEEKIAKREKFQVTTSLGKGVTIPNFSNILPDDADSVVEGKKVRKRMQFTRNMAYGQLISQSVESGTVLTSKDTQDIEVIYSAGQPYIKDYRRGEILEGDLQKLFFEEFHSKGANIKYQVRYVNSSETYGTIVGMSKFNQFLPLDDTITFDISLGNQSAASSEPSNEE